MIDIVGVSLPEARREESVVSIIQKVQARQARCASLIFAEGAKNSSFRASNRVGSFSSIYYSLLFRYPFHARNAGP